jgi:hypothetical protein
VEWSKLLEYPECSLKAISLSGGEISWETLLVLRFLSLRMLIIDRFTLASLSLDSNAAFSFFGFRELVVGGSEKYKESPSPGNSIEKAPSVP